MSTSLAPASGLRPQDRRALIVGGMVLVALLGYSRAIRPAIQQLASDRRSVQDERALLVRERALIAAAPTLPARQKDAERVLAAERPRLFAGDSVAATAELTSYLSQIASASGVNLTTLEARAPASIGGLTKLSADVRGEGSWRQVLAFVRLLEVSGQLVDVSSIRLERGARGGPLGGDLISISATLTGYGRGAP